MEGYDIYIASFGLATIIPIIYMTVFVLKGKEKGIVPFFAALYNLLGIYVASVIPIVLIISGFEAIKSGDIVTGCVVDVIAIAFSLPFLSGLVKNIQRDFEVPEGFNNDITTMLVGIVGGIVVTALLICFTIGYISGNVSLDAVIAVLLMFVTTMAILIISGHRKKIAYDGEKLEEFKKFERKVGIILSVFILIFFVVIMIL